MNNETLKAPFPYFGGKSKVAGVVWKRFGDVPNYVEPFFGSGAVLLGRQNWKPDIRWLETVNDKSGYVANFWRAVTADPEGVAHYADWPVNECVPAGTMIATPTGEIAVENIRPGMTVLGDQDGETVSTRVVATKQSQAREFYNVDDLLLTGNHPVWTLEGGYVEASHLAVGMHIKKLRWSVCENDLIMLQLRHEQQAVGNLHIDRSANTTGALCGRDVPQESALPRALIAGYDRRQNTSGLLDSVSDRRWHKAAVRSDRKRNRRRMARIGATLDSLLSTIDQANKPNRWGRRNQWLCANAGIAPKMVGDACGCPVCTGARASDEGQKAYTGSHSQNPGRQQGAEDARQYETEIVRLAQAKTIFAGTARQDDSSQQRSEENGRIQTARNCLTCPPEQADSPCGNRRNLLICRCGCTRHWRKQGCYSVCTKPEYPLQRLHAPTPVAVYNFQTTTGNYYANRILVHNCDLHARHVWLVHRKDALSTNLEGDPDWFDAKIAGWWAWGMCCWIGSGFCSGKGPWGWAEDENGDSQLVHLGNAGKGVKRKRVHLGNAGTGVNRKLVHLTHQGRGIHQASQSDGLYEWMQALSKRLKRVRVCCGDWTRVMGPTVTEKNGLTGIFLDPPYSAEAGRCEDLYEQEDLSVAHDVRRWCVENGDNPMLMIAFCGYDGEGHEDLERCGWTAHAWKAHGGYGSQGDGAGRENAEREVIWFSPHCLSGVKRPSLFDLEPIA